MLLSLWMPLVLSLVLWHSFEKLLIPRPRGWFKRPAAAVAVDIGTWAALYGGFTLLLERGWFAMVILGALHMVIIQVSNTKATTLREPFLCQDFEYFVDMVKHPRMYLPFFGIGLTIVSTLAGIAAIVAGFWLEPSLFLVHQGASHQGTEALVTVAGITLAGLILLRAGFNGIKPTKEEETNPLDPNDELIRFGLTSLIWRQGKELFTPLDKNSGEEAFKSPVLPTLSDDSSLPHVVIVQSESFFDPRRWYKGIRREVLAQWDEVANQAEQRGQLEVPVWGANTVRSECAFLTGLAGGALGGHRFNPYHALSHQGIPSLLTPLKQLGYRCIAIHPYPASFYLRDKVFPNMGFDEFIDISAFSEDQKDGQYTSDLALTDKVDALLAEATQPLAIMLITMENHGPLHLEKPQASAENWYSLKPDIQSSDLTVYLRHLHNSGLMVKKLTQSLEEHSRSTSLAQDNSHKMRNAVTREGILCFYGDHVPIMASTYKALGYPDGMTEYFIWSTQGQAHEATEALSLDKLGSRLLTTILSKTSAAGDASSSTEGEAFNTEKY